jgi:hypothetical protein
MHELLLALSILAFEAMPDPLLRAPHRQVRAVDGRAAAALAEGVRRSPTLAALVAAINRSDVIAYVESVHTLPPMVSGRMVLTTRGTRVRYVRIEVSTRLFPDELISTIAHELQHAVELAEHPAGPAESAFIELNQRIAASAMFGFDTEAAVRVGEQVMRELGQRK